MFRRIPIALLPLVSIGQKTYPQGATWRRPRNDVQQVQHTSVLESLPENSAAQSPIVLARRYASGSLRKKTLKRSKKPAAKPKKPSVPLKSATPKKSKSGVKKTVKRKTNTTTKAKSGKRRLRGAVAKKKLSQSEIQTIKYNKRVASIAKLYKSFKE
ncbi:hypothetical protein ADEAN_000067100 [Angomonas deanei]|uniref:Uncharacterized protein n=1 Tax=Angomonas deanei TaxID=59799 RepID=A0A7G2C1P8_9TRYP|nr:hypothetical protein ADEAN_000067100 [Angomonas deanei]